MSKLFQTTSIVAVATLLATAPIAGLAQDTTQDERTAPEVTTPDTPAADKTPDIDAPADDGAAIDGAPAAEERTEMDAPADEGAAADEAPATDDAPSSVTGDDPAAEADMATEEPVNPVEGQIVLQSEDTILAKDLMGSTVYASAGDETVGSISDLIINLDGSVEGVVIGVGGFLGIGKKLVAIEMSSLDVSSDAAGSARLTTGATKADLEAAEAFVTAKEQEDAAAAEQGGTGMPSELGADGLDAPASVE